MKSAAMEAIQAVIFDCDGTLVDSEVPGMDVIHEQACALGLTFTREQAHQQFRGVRMAECIAWIRLLIATGKRKRKDCMKRKKNISRRIGGSGYEHTLNHRRDSSSRTRNGWHTCIVGRKIGT